MAASRGGVPRLYRGDMFTLFDPAPGQARDIHLLVVTVNVTTTRRPDRRGVTSGALPPEEYGVMGAGCALTAARRWPELRRWWARRVAGGARDGFHSVRLLDGSELTGDASQRWLGCLVTKTNWWEPSTRQLVVAGLQSLREWVDAHPECRRCVLPLPGAGLGRLPPEECRDQCRRFLDDRFIVCELPG